MRNPTEITRLLNEVGTGTASAAERLYPLVYDELRRLAQSQLEHERPGHTLQATALVHEAYLRMIDQTRVEWKNRSHFFAIAAQAVRRILVDYARRRARQKRGGQAIQVPLDEVMNIPARGPSSP
jgi:RNA polymerase sigma-70 factor (ECF subfamily)